MDNDIIFAEGFVFKRDPEAADWKICGISVKVSEAVAFLQAHEVDGWVNLDVLRAKTSGKVYGKLDTWTPNQGTAGKEGVAQAKTEVVGTTLGRLREDMKPKEAPPFIDDDVPFSNYEYRTVV